LQSLSSKPDFSSERLAGIDGIQYRSNIWLFREWLIIFQLFRRENYPQEFSRDFEVVYGDDPTGVKKYILLRLFAESRSKIGFERFLKLLRNGRMKLQFQVIFAMQLAIFPFLPEGDSDKEIKNQKTILENLAGTNLPSEEQYRLSLEYSKPEETLQAAKEFGLEHIVSMYTDITDLTQEIIHEQGVEQEDDEKLLTA